MDILVLNTKFESVAIVDTFEEMIWTDRYSDYGDFELTLSANTKLLEFIKEDYYLWTSESEHCMIIEDITIDSDAEDGNRFIVTGRSLESILERRIVWGQKILNGNFQDAIKNLLNESFISPSISERKVDNFVFEASTNPRITGLTIDAQFFGEDLYSVVNKLCEENQIGFKIVLNDSNQFVFSLYAGTDRSYDQIENPYVVFSPNLENIINSNYYTSKADFKNVTLVAGEGEGAARKMTSVGSASGLDRREIFTDARDVSSETETAVLSESQYISQLQTRGTETLSEHKIKTAFEGEVEATQLYTYGEDFFVGDIVQITNEYGHEGTVYISELVISQRDEGMSIYPTFKTIEDKEVKTE